MKYKTMVKMVFDNEFTFADFVDLMHNKMICIKGCEFHFCDNDEDDNPPKSEGNIESPNSADGQAGKVSLPCGENNKQSAQFSPDCKECVQRFSGCTTTCGTSTCAKKWKAHDNSCENSAHL